MTDIIVKWIKDGANAQEGVQLMQRAGTPSLLYEMVAANPSANRQFMIRYLRDIYSVTETAQETVVSLPVKSFRDEFAFLNSPDCPVELEALASRKFARYHSYVDLHKKLRDCTSFQECAKISRELIDSYLENRSIWQELDYYKKNKSILGKHPIFAEFARHKNMLSMSVKDLMIRRQQVEMNIWRVSNEIKKGDKPHLLINRTAKLEGYQAELAELNRLIG